MTTQTKTAHYFAGKGQKFVIISNTFSPIGGEHIAVSGKVEARRIAAQRGATPWNF